MSKFLNQREFTGLIVFLLTVGVLVLVVRQAEPRRNPHFEATVAQLQERDSVALHPFDPNTVSYEELRAIGLSRQEAVSLVKFRAAGKIFRIAEDVALCYGISDSAYRVLAPYITIGAAYRIHPKSYREYTPAKRDTLPRIAPSPFLIDTVSAAYLRAIGAFTKRQAEAFIRWRDRSGFRDMEEVRACYVVDDSIASWLEPYIRFSEPEKSPWEAPIELNTADSSRLRSVVGIGEKSVVRILAYRSRLGGFHRVEQLAEVEGVTETNFEKILQQIWCDSNEIQKIDINFATPMRLREHPYIAPRTLRRLLKQRALKGGWNSTGEMIEQNILTHEEAERLRPYLVFGADSLHSAQGMEPTI
ncbi:MAG: helix-hairpin-helix domain-containing protein [Alistipes sp.]|nr:helix-hairpin-helix domain-containing protein [Alistipes sp.]